MNGLYLVKQVAKERLVEDNTSINRFVVCGGILKVFETMRLTMVCGVSRLVSIRTDCVYVENPKEIEESHLVNSNEPILANLGKLKKEEEVHPVKKITEDETEKGDWEGIFKEELMKGTGEMINGIGGSGKTFLGVQKFKAEEGEKMVLAFTNKACNVIRKRFSDEGIDTDCISTLSKFLNDERFNTNKLLDKLVNLDLIWIEEISMVPTKFWILIYKAWLKKKEVGKDIKIILTGDMNQIISIEHNKRYNTTKSQAIRQICLTFITLKYRQESARSTRKQRK